jgi:endonuclease/exonuclease/phosphatase family metal-dependent hydrolase
LVPIAFNDVSLGWHGNAMLVRRGLGVAKISRIALPGTEPRGAIGVHFDDGMTVIGVHLGLLRRSRRKQLEAITSQFSTVESIVIIGDMNEWAPTRGFEPLQDRFKLHTPGRSFHARRPMAALDRVALSHNLSLVDAGVAQSALAKRASDHLPIWADVGYLDNKSGSFASLNNALVAAPITKL